MHKIVIKNSNGNVKQVVNPIWHGFTDEQIGILALGVAVGASQVYKSVKVEVYDGKGNLVTKKAIKL